MFISKLMDSEFDTERTSKECITACLGFVLSCLVAITLQILFFSPISPQPLDLPRAFTDPIFPSNSQLQRVVKLGEGNLNKPEDVCFDKKGILYTATRDGWIKRLHKNGTWDDWSEIGGYGLLGITVSKTGSLIVCDVEKGLLKVDEDGVTVLTSHFNGTKIRMVGRSYIRGISRGSAKSCRSEPSTRGCLSSGRGEPSMRGGFMGMLQANGIPAYYPHAFGLMIQNPEWPQQPQGVYYPDSAYYLLRDNIPSLSSNLELNDEEPEDDDEAEDGLEN